MLKYIVSITQEIRSSVFTLWCFKSTLKYQVLGTAQWYDAMWYISPAIYPPTMKYLVFVETVSGVYSTASWWEEFSNRLIVLDTIWVEKC